MATNDLSSLNLLYCQPPVPGSISVTPTETTAVLGWGAVSNSSKYGVEYRLRGLGKWSVADETITGTSHMVERLACGSDYQFRVSAYGSGTTYAAAWSEAAAVTGTTTACVSPVFYERSYAFEVSEDADVNAEVGTMSATDPCNLSPEFDQDSYRFGVSEKAAIGHSVGSVSATDPNEDDTLAYSITGGDEAGKFDIDGGSREITVAGSLGTEAADSYTLTLEASDDRGGTDTASLGIAVTDVAE